MNIGENILYPLREFLDPLLQHLIKMLIHDSFCAEFQLGKECIPVGCVPPVAVADGRGVSLVGGLLGGGRGSPWRGAGVSLAGGGGLLGSGVSLVGGSPWWRVSLVEGLLGRGYPSMH